MVCWREDWTEGCRARRKRAIVSVRVCFVACEDEGVDVACDRMGREAGLGKEV